LKAIIADTTPLYGAIDTSDQYHSRAQAELRRIESEDLTVIISFPVYIETYSLLLYRLGFEQANHFTQNCLESANLINPTEDQYFAAIAKAKQFPVQTITIVDALTAIISIELDLPVWSYDYHFDIMRVKVWR
jgi:predicted nucleic acid-binding protein